MPLHRSMTFLGTLALLFALLVSFYLAFAWGEMAGIPQGGDKTSLGGLFVISLFMGMRWAAVALALAFAVGTEAFAFLAPGRGGQAGLILGAHLLLGIASVTAFNWIANGLTLDVMGPQRWCWFFGVVLPLPALAAASWGLYREWLGRHRLLAVLLGAGLLLLHLLPYRNRLLDMRQTTERLRQKHADEARDTAAAPARSPE